MSPSVVRSGDDLIRVAIMLAVSDVERSVSFYRDEHAALSARGLRFLTPPAQPPWGGWRCFAQDPDDYLIEIEQPPPAS